MIRKSWIGIALLIWTVGFLASSNPSEAGKKYFGIATGGTGGTYYPLGSILAQALNQRVPDILVAPQAGNASVANCNLIREHLTESAFVQNNVAYAAYNGTDQFRGKPANNLRGIASLYPETVQIVARADSGIKTLWDIKGKRLIPGDRGSGTEFDALNILRAYGYTYKNFAGVDWLGFSGAAQRLHDKQADVTFTTAGWPTASIKELSMTTRINLIPVEENMIRKLITMYPFYSRIVIPRGTYKGQTRDVATVTTMAQWVVDADVSDDVVYNLTRALWEKRPDGQSGADIMAKAHPKGKDISLKTALVGMAIPLHPGAARYYKEKEMIK